MCRLLPPLIALTVVVLAGPAFAQAAGNNNVNVSWAALDPGNDWSWQMIQSVFPVNGAPPTDTGTAATVIGKILGQITGFVTAIAMAYVSYITIMNIHRVAESSQILTNAMTSMLVVRIGFAAIMMFPLSSGFSTGQAAVVQFAKWGIGMATAVYTNAVQAIGPDAMVIALPMIPGTETTVLNLMQDELCRALVNQAAKQPGLVPAPTPTLVSNAYGGAVTYSYSMTPGNETTAPVCGTVTITQPLNAPINIAGVNTDMSATQRTILENVLANDIRPTVQTVAANFWNDKKAADLNPLLNVFTTATSDYTQQLTTAATNVTNQIRTAIQTQDARNGNIGLIQNENQLSSLGWTSAGAYYLEFARINGQTLSLVSGLPVVNMPTFEGLSNSLKTDLAPLYAAQTGFLTKLRTYVKTTDGIDVPGGNADLFMSRTNGNDGASAIEQVFRAIDFTPSLLQFFTDQMSPTGNQWTDPFGGLMGLGRKLIITSVTALGLAGLASSTTGTAATTVFNILTLNWAAAGAAVSSNLLVQFFATPIFLCCMALLIPGLTIAFVLPMIPWVMWMAGVAGYLILVCEAVIAVPLWMLAHMTLEGEGLHGRAIQGYELIFNILFRPVLMLLGLFLGYFIFTAMSWLIRESFGVAAGFVLANGGLVTNFLGLFVLLSIYVMTHVVAALMSFRMISLVPHHLPKLIGFASANRVDMDEFGRDAALIGVGGALKKLESTVQPNANSRLAGQSQNNQIGYTTPRLTGPSGNNSSQGGAKSSGNMDSTLHASTDVPQNNHPTQET